MSTPRGSSALRVARMTLGMPLRAFETAHVATVLVSPGFGAEGGTLGTRTRESAIGGDVPTSPPSNSQRFWGAVQAVRVAGPAQCDRSRGRRARAHGELEDERGRSGLSKREKGDKNGQRGDRTRKGCRLGHFPFLSYLIARWPLA